MRSLQVFISLVLLHGLGTTAAFAQPAGGTKADRSAEGRLREVFEAMGKLRTLEARIETVAREKKGGPWMPGGVTDLAYEAGKGFAVGRCSSWGEQIELRSDGKSLLTDPMDLTQGVTLKDSKATIYESDAQLTFNGELFSPLFLVLAGPKAFDELVSKDGEIVSIPAFNGWEGIRFKSTRIGTVKVYFDAGHKFRLVHRFEFDNLDRHKELATLWGEWGYEVPEDPLDIHDITYRAVDRRLRKGVFATTPPKGVKVSDQRKKAATPGHQCR